MTISSSICVCIQNLSKYSKRFKGIAIFTNWIRTNGHTSTRLFIRNSGIWQFHWLDLVNTYLHAKNYRNIPSGLKVEAIKARLFIKKSGIWQCHLLGLVNMYLHAKQNQNSPSGLKVQRFLQTNYGRTDMVIIELFSLVLLSDRVTADRAIFVVMCVCVCVCVCVCDPLFYVP